MCDENDFNDEYIIKPKDVISVSDKTELSQHRMIAFKINKHSVIKGSIVYNAIINKIEKVYGIMTKCDIKNGTSGTFNGFEIFSCSKGRGILLKKSIPILDINEDGSVKSNTTDDIKKAKGDFSEDECVMLIVNENLFCGKVKLVLQINEILCYNVQLKDKIAKSMKISEYVTVIENDIIPNKIKNPEDFDIYTYFKEGARVKVKDRGHGVVKDYVKNNNQFHYLIENDNEVFNASLEDVKTKNCIELDNKGFLSVDDPQKYDIVTSMKKGSVVDIKDERSEMSGHISWMGFDKDHTFKFGITLEKPSGKSDGKFYNERLFQTERNCAKLVDSSKIIPDKRFQKEIKRRDEPKMKSEVVNDYQTPRYKFDYGKYKGIQGNSNSCYLDTSIFAIFSFNVFLENLITEDTDDDVKDLRDILSSHIIYPLRKNQYVSFDKVRIFRKKLQEHSPNGKFLENERDPEEFLEKLFHLLTPTLFLFKTKLLTNCEFEQKCFLTQLFYQCTPSKVKLSVLEMMTLTFLESDMLISEPPKALIVQLPRHGREMKKFERVSIPSFMDITPFILVCDKVCEICKNIFKNIFICKKCSAKKYKLIYYCEKDRKCGHETQILESTDHPYQGNVELELVAILCIEKTHYIAYTKTNEISQKWIYFDSMEELVDGELIPRIRETSLQEYFNDTDKLENLKSNDKHFQSDVERIEHYAFVCFYKNPTLEFYNEDFNSDK